MSVQDCVKPKIVDDSDEDDDKPIVFKRTSTTVNKNSLNSSLKKNSSRKPDGQSDKQASEVRSSNGQSFKNQDQKHRPAVPSKDSQEKSHTVGLKTSNSPAKSPLRGNLKSSTSGNDQSKCSPPQKPTPTVIEGKRLNNLSAKPEDDSEDSDDDRPLSYKYRPAVPTKDSHEKSPKVSPKTSNSSAKSPLAGNLKASTLGDDQSKLPPPQKPTPTVKEKKQLNDLSAKPEDDFEDSEDDKPLSYKHRPVAPIKATQEKSPSVSPETSVVKSSPLIGNVKASTTKEENQLINSTAKLEKDLEDSDNDKPLSVKINGSSKGNSNPVDKEVNNTSDKPKVKPEDSDDEIPLSSKFQKKYNSELSTSKSRDIDERQLVIPKVQENGVAMKDNQIKRSSTMVNKRPLGEVKNSSQSSIKKPKLVDGSSPSSAKQVPAKPKSEVDDEDDDDLPISQRIKKASTSASKSSPAKQKVTKVVSKTSFKKSSKRSKKVVKKSKFSKSSKMLPGSGEGQKWTTLVHSGVIFPPPYTPHGVKMLYKGKPVDLTPEQEEVATMYAVMLETEYMTKPKFKENFMTDWRKILGKNHVIQKLEDCDFSLIYEWHQKEKEKKKQMTSEEKKALKEEKLKLEEKYMWAIVDGVKEKVGNFRVEPPGLFRGRGEHPKMGKLKKRICPSDITINIGKNAPIPECPVPGQRWKEIRHDNTVTWLAYWIDPINSKEFKYVFLAASSSLKGQSDKEKYEKARMLKNYIDGIREAYTRDFTNKDMTKKQIAVATYLIDELALRAGNEKDDDEADTVGCCTLKVENVEPVLPHTLKFDFLGKDSIRYQNEVVVKLPAFKAIQQFRVGKKGSDNLFDQLDTNKLNAHLKELMPGLTAKVFRTFNASITLDGMLSKGTKGGDVAEKVVVYQHANKKVAIICNHQRTVSKSHSAQITRLDEKIDELKGILGELKTDLARAKKGKPPVKSSDGKNKRNLAPEALERKISQTNAKIEKMERDKETKEDLKTVALGTSKINYLDPRITVAWCKRYEVPIEKMFNKSLLAKFAWAMDVEPDFRF